jgi:4-methyl-5(b-hydroxyethyl)-thiazole monophosphate biosynthesis
MSKKAIIILAEGFEEIEAVTPIDVLRRANVEVVVAGLDHLEVKGSRNITIKADGLLKETKLDADLYIFPGGGPGADNLAASETVLNLIKTKYEEGKIIASICASPVVVLYKAGILSGKTITSYPGYEDQLGDEVTYSEKSVVVDGPLITSRGPGTAFDFSLTLVKVLTDETVAETVAKKAIYR